MTGQNFSQSRARSHSGAASQKVLSPMIADNLSVGEPVESPGDDLPPEGPAIQRLLSLLNCLPDSKPPPDLIRRTMNSITEAGG